jgi:hypothetical protein
LKRSDYGGLMAQRLDGRKSFGNLVKYVLNVVEFAAQLTTPCISAAWCRHSIDCPGLPTGSVIDRLSLRAVGDQGFRLGSHG